MKIALRTKFFYVLMCASLIAALAIGAQPATPVSALPGCTTPTAIVVTLKTTTPDFGTNPSVYGTGVKFIATLSHGAATGNVQFYDGAAALGGPIALAGGVATTPAISQLSVAGSPHAITAAFVSTANPYCDSTSAALSHTITKKQLTVVGTVIVNPASRTYDGTNIVAFSGGVLFGVVGGDAVTLDQKGTMVDKNVGTGKVVTPAFALLPASPSVADNYSLVQPTGSFTVNITQAPMHLLNVASNNKVYDGNKVATFDLATVAVNPAEKMPLDAVFYSAAGATGTFTDKLVASGNQLVTAAGFALTGADAGNYLLTQPVHGDGYGTDLRSLITAKPLTVSGLSASNKVYDGTTTATVAVSSPALVGVVAGDTVTLTATPPFSGTFNTKDVLTANLVTFGAGQFALAAGGDSANYVLDPAQPTTPASITPKGLTLASLSGGIVVNNKDYDGTTAATFNMGVVQPLVGSIAADGNIYPVDDADAIGTFASANVGIAIPVTASGWYTTSSPNYFLSVQPAGLTANITQATLHKDDLRVENSHDGLGPDYGVILTYNGFAYNAALHAYDPISGLEVPGVFSNIKYNGLAALPINVGDYDVSADFTPSSGANYKYDNVANSGAVLATMWIRKATPSLYIANNYADWTGSPIAANIMSNVPGTVFNVSYNGSATAPTEPGSYAVLASFTPTDTVNYSSRDNVALTFTIEKATAELSVTNSPQPYTGAAQVATVSSSVAGTVSNMEYWFFTGSGWVEVLAPTNVGSYEVYVNFTPTDTAHYATLTEAYAGDFVITKGTPTATLAVTNSPVAYDGGAHSAVVAITASSVPGTVANISTGGAAFQVNSGTYAVTADFVPTDTANWNSVAGLPAGNFVISPMIQHEIIINGGFNTYTGTSMIPSYWDASKFSALDGKSNTRKEGLNSVRIQGTAVRKMLSQEILSSGSAGSTLNFKFWVKGQAIPAGGVCTAQVRLYNGNTLVQVKTVACATGTYSWTSKAASFNAFGDYTKVIIRITYFKASGYVWFDGVSLLK